ncbi:MAG: ATP-dependent DNA ligase [Acidimicrobiales bacterium]|nr:ATP-dependent DNA ligase [Acidimicrobiales bacterium]
MDLPVLPPVKPMLAKAVATFPEGDVSYEPKWDGFRCIVFRDGDDIVLGSRNERPLTRYFPEVVANLGRALPDRCVLDGEIIVVSDDRLDFDALQQRIHPAESRINLLAERTPAAFVAFDTLALGDEDLRDLPFSARRTRLEAALSHLGPTALDGGGVAHLGGVHLCPTTDELAVARRWFEAFEGAGLDGLIAKPLGGRYEPDKRVQFKIKHKRTADCVVAGLRWHKDGQGVGSLLLGLYVEAGTLHHLGVAASFSVARRKELRALLEPLAVDAVDDHPWAEWARAEAHANGRLPGAVSRWNAAKDLSWVPLRIERVAEVAYQTVTNGRFRGVASFVRWREDREPASCGYDQLVEAEPLGVSTVLSGGAPR